MFNNGQNRSGGFQRERFTHTYEDIISIENLLEAWKEFVCGKHNKEDVLNFQINLMHNILSLHRDLKHQVYTHGPYHPFKINDPKPREIHKATVRDRLLHHAIYRKLYPFFDRTFIADSQYYIRYADDFVFLSHDRAQLEAALPHVRRFLQEKLRLTLHPDKVSISTIASGVDFLGWVHFPDHRILRTATKRRMLKRVACSSDGAVVESYRGLLRHGNSHKLSTQLDTLKKRQEHV